MLECTETGFFFPTITACEVRGEDVHFQSTGLQYGSSVTAATVNMQQKFVK